MRILAFVFAAGIAACSSTETPEAPPAPPPAEVAPPEKPAPVAPATPPAARYPAAHPPMPQVVSLGGRVLVHPKVVVVTYEGDTFRDLLEGFPDALGKSTYWASVTAEYGVGAISSRRPVHLTEDAPTKIDDRDLKRWLEDKLDGTHGEWDPPDADTMYVIYFPENTTYTLFGKTGCVEFGASDNLLVTKDGRQIPYVAIPRCHNQPGLDEAQTLTGVTSHELFEESTDPFKDAYVTNDDANIGWAWDPPFSEIGDMCITDPKEWIVPPDLGFTVQRAWSNAAARAGKNPCVPAPPGLGDAPYFNALPVFTEEVNIQTSGWNARTKGVHVPVGETRTIDLALFSDRPTSPWRVYAYDLAAEQGREPELELHVGRGVGVDGDVLGLTVKSLRAGQDGGSRFIVFSQLGKTATFAYGFVAN
jgi:hypothetical protein